MRPRLNRTREELLAFVEARIERDESGCWLWTGVIDRHGYGRINGGSAGVEQATLRAHRVVYELLVGPIPEGLFLDHLCFVRRCVNPAHLEPVTNQENLLRGSGPTCRRGHPKSAYVTTPSGSRYCRPCHAIQARAAYYRRLGRPIPEAEFEGCPVGLAMNEQEAA